MNGNIKFHKPTGPAFNHGEKWIGSGNAGVYIDSVRHHNTEGNNCNDYTVRYFWYNSTSGEKVFHEKDGWNFQVRYMHIADKVVLDGRKNLTKLTQLLKGRISKSINPNNSVGYSQSTRKSVIL